MSDMGCTIKLFDRNDQLVQAADEAILINPANAPILDISTLDPDFQNRSTMGSVRSTSSFENIRVTVFERAELAQQILRATEPESDLTQLQPMNLTIPGEAISPLQTLSPILPGAAISPIQRMRANTPGLTKKDRLAVLTSKYWGNQGIRLTVGFLDNPPSDLRARILQEMNAWGQWANVRFDSTLGSAQVRIARDADGYWSYLGTDILSVNPNQPTMNLQGFTMNTSEAEFHRVIRHETGHTMGFPHEHMRQEIINRMDREKTINYFMSTQGWTRDEAISQVLTPLPQSALIETAQPDINSIMCYWLPASIMKDGIAVNGGRDIGTQDAQFAARVYPPPVTSSTSSSIWPNGKAYFFKGPKYVQYDAGSNRVDRGYPRPIQWDWTGFPASFAAGVDAQLVWENRKVYFFKGKQHLCYDINADRVDPGYPRPIAGDWTDLWSSNIDAGIVWPNGKVYFFKGSQYIRYDIKLNRADPGFPLPIQGNWPGFPVSFASGIDAAVLWNNGKAYFFKGSEYLRYDINADMTDAGFPRPIRNDWTGLWDNAIDA